MTTGIAFVKPRVGNRMRRWMTVTLAVIALLIGIHTLICRHLRRQVATRIEAIRAAGLPASVEELNAWSTRPAGGQNAADLYMEAFARLRDPTPAEYEVLAGKGRTNLWSRTEPLRADIRAAIETSLADQREALELAHRAAKLKGCRYPTNAGGIYETASVIPFHVVSMNRLMGYAAVLRAEKGDVDGAVDAMADQIALSESLRNEPTLSAALSRISCASAVWVNAQRILSRCDWTDEQLARFGAAIQSTDDSGMMFRAMVGERVQMVAYLGRGSQDILKGAWEPGAAWDQKVYAIWINLSGERETTTLRLLDVHSRLIEASRQPFPDNLKSVQSIEEECEKQREGSLFQWFTFPFSEAFDRWARCVAYERAAHVATAVERYRLVQGRWPDDLAELVPRFLDAEPQDPFDGKPMRYKHSPHGFVVYSVGENGWDNGGDDRMEDKYSKPKDLVFVVERPPAAAASDSASGK